MIYGKKDSQDAAPVAHCVHCGGEIYSGEEAYIPAEYAGMVCRDCIKDWLFETYLNVLTVKCEAGAR